MSSSRQYKSLDRTTRTISVRGGYVTQDDRVIDLGYVFPLACFQYDAQDEDWATNPTEVSLLDQLSDEIPLIAEKFRLLRSDHQ